MTNVKKNYLYSLMYQMLSIGLPLLTIPYLSRTLGPEKIGIYSFTYSVASFFILFAMLGVNNYGNRSCAMVRNDKRELSKSFWEIYILQCIFAVFSISFYIFYIIILGNEQSLIAWIQIMVVISALFDVNWFYFSLEKFKVVVNRNIAVKLTTVVLILLIVKSPNDLWKYTMIMALSSLVSQIIVWTFLYKNIEFVLPKISKVFLHLKPNLLLFIPVIAVSLYKVMDKVMIGALSNMTQTGLYDSAEKMIIMPLGIITALGTVMLPRMSYLIKNKKSKEVKKYLDNSMMFVMFLSIGMAFGIMGISEKFIPLFLGTEFLGSAKLAMYMAPAIIFYSWANVLRTQYLIPNKSDKAYILSVLFGAVINLTLNFLFIPKYGALGAVIATVAAEATVCIVQTINVRKEIQIYRYFINSMPFLLFGIIMYCSIKLIESFSTNILLVVFLQITIGALIYISFSLIFLMLFNRELLSVIYTKK